MRHRMNVVLQMVMALITAILLGQLWLFTVTLDAMEDRSRFDERRDRRGGVFAAGVRLGVAADPILSCVQNERKRENDFERWKEKARRRGQRNGRSSCG